MSGTTPKSSATRGSSTHTPSSALASVLPAPPPLALGAFEAHAVLGAAEDGLLVLQHTDSPWRNEHTTSAAALGLAPTS
jgi:hypothetical protein